VFRAPMSIDLLKSSKYKYVVDSIFKYLKVICEKSNRITIRDEKHRAYMKIRGKEHIPKIPY